MQPLKMEVRAWRQENARRKIQLALRAETAWYQAHADQMEKQRAIERRKRARLTRMDAAITRCHYCDARVLGDHECMKERRGDDG